MKHATTKSLAATIASLISFAAATGFALSPEDKCEADKNKIAGKYAFCRQKAEAKAIKKGEATDYSKCNGALADKWSKADAKAVAKGTSCIDSVNATAIQDFVAAHSDTVAAALDDNGSLTTIVMLATGDVTSHGPGSDGDLQAGQALAFVDNADGTITEGNTGLMWTKKDDSAGLHGRGTTYAWSTGTNDLDGTLQTAYLDVLNDVSGGGASCFAGHCDWRIPNIRELQTILDYSGVSPTVDPAFHNASTCTGCSDVTLPTCSCTSLVSYWASTTFNFDPTQAWIIVPGVGITGFIPKTSSTSAIAVRGGL